MIDQALLEVVRKLPGYEPGPSSWRWRASSTGRSTAGRHALIEAGTGSGKSFGYLIPLLESGKTAVISTGTIALQEQLLNKDIPFLEQAYGKQIKVAMAKGRSNYVCLRKLDEVMQRSCVRSIPRPAQVAGADPVRSAAGDWNGDRGELPVQRRRRLWADSLASDPRTAWRAKCPNYVRHPAPDGADRLRGRADSSSRTTRSTSRTWRPAPGCCRGMTWWSSTRRTTWTARPSAR